VYVHRHTYREIALYMKIMTTVHKSLYGGNSLAYYEGMAIFLPHTIPGEQVQVEIIKKKKDYGFGNIISIEKSSPDRIEPECPNFGQCGGCSYLHMQYERELQEKILIIKDAITRIAHIPEIHIPPIETYSSHRFHYRSHASIKADHAHIGFYQRSSQNIIPFPPEGCLLLARSINDTLASIASPPVQGNFKIAMDTFHACHYSEKKGLRLTEKTSGITYMRDLYSFFQANHYLRHRMLEKVAVFADLKGDETILDLGCGIGFFTLYMAQYCNSITGFDINAQSIALARKNSALNSRTNTRFKVQKLSDIRVTKKGLPLIIVDPPRSGLDSKARQVIRHCSPKKIIYISCNPTTWSRDIKEFLQKSYALTKITFIDMFPATHHIELISLLEHNA
jgi:23S rRNA (uracil1939-C5)-methyltransferase